MNGTEQIGKTAGLVADYGILVVIGSLFVIGLASAIWLAFRYWNRKLSDEYIKKDQVKDYIKKNNPSILRQEASELPNLLDHRFFSESNRQIRIAESSSSSPLEKDLTTWTIRGYRDAFALLINEANKDKDGFDSVIGDSSKFRANIDKLLVEAAGAIRYRLVDEFDFPQIIYAKWQKSRELSDEIIVNMLDIASERSTPYDRIQCVLDSQYARVLMLRKAVIDFSETIPQDMIDSYKPPSEADHSTMQGFKPLNRKR